MIFETTARPGKPLRKKARCLLGFGWVLGLLVFPASSLAMYFPGPQDFFPTVSLDSPGTLESVDLSRNHHLIQTDPSTGELLPSELNWASVDDLPGASNPDGSERDPFSDEVIEEDPFGDHSVSDADFEEDPFAEEEDDIPPLSDPFERWYNRPVYVFNDYFYEYLMRPVAESYRFIIPEDLRLIIRNMFRNILFPQRLVSSLFQGDFEKTGRVLSRTLINTTLGIGGMFEVANPEFGIKPVDEDFGQAMGKWGIPAGPYIVLPILGPSTARDAVGVTVDAVLNPLFWVVPDFITGASITSGQMVNEISFYIEDIKAFKDGAIDPYISFREFYHESREKLIDD